MVQEIFSGTQHLFLFELELFSNYRAPALATKHDARRIAKSILETA
jgi:hypothetical protein